MRHRGMTLIELLTVIAIIAILAAIIFPIAGTARERARRAGCTSNLHNIGQALQMYKMSEGGYPPQLLGFVDPYQTTANGTPTPVQDITNGFLYKDYVKDIGSFKCPNNTRTKAPTEWTVAYWPQAILPGTGDPINSLAGTIVKKNLDGSGNENRQFYTYDSYDIGWNSLASPPRYELRYSLFWTELGINPDQTNGRRGDNLRQLAFRNPDPSAVVTWCSYHFTSGRANGPNRQTVEHGVNAQVLFLDGSVKPIDQQAMDLHAWAFKAGP